MTRPINKSSVTQCLYLDFGGMFSVKLVTPIYHVTGNNERFLGQFIICEVMAMSVSTLHAV